VTLKDGTFGRYWYGFGPCLRDSPRSALVAAVVELVEVAADQPAVAARDTAAVATAAKSLNLRFMR
jgi:hypothetical protein